MDLLISLVHSLWLQAGEHLSTIIDGLIHLGLRWMWGLSQSKSCCENGNQSLIFAEVGAM